MMREYDFYCVEDDTHFKRDTCTEEQAKAYAVSFNLRFEEAKDGKEEM